MRIKNGFLVKKILDDFMVVPTGDSIVDFAVAVSLNETGAFLWEQLKTDKTKAELTEALLAEYDIPNKEIAENDVDEFIALLNTHGFLEE